MLQTTCGKFKAYHYEIVASLETDEGARQEQVLFDEHQRKSMEFVNRLGDLLAAPQPSVLSQPLINNHLLVRPP